MFALTLFKKIFIIGISCLISALWIGTVINIYVVKQISLQNFQFNARSAAMPTEQAILDALEYGAKLDKELGYDVHGISNHFLTHDVFKEIVTQYAIIDTSGLILAHNDKEMYFEKDKYLPDHIVQQLINLKKPLTLKTAHSYDTYIPILHDGILHGTILMGFKASLIDDKIYQIIKNSIIITLVAFIVSLIIFSITISKFITNPLKQIIGKIHYITESGDLSGRVEVNSQDEIYELAEVFNQMIKELKRLDVLKDEFLANTSHELRTPLNGIIGIVESLIDGAAGKLSPQANTNMIMVVQEAKRLSNLVNDILDFSKMKNQDLPLQLKPIDIKSTANLVLTLSNHLKGPKQLTLTNDIPESLPLAQADENRLQQILINIVGNAVKFTHQGEITISAQEEKGQIRISVKDTGIGIPKDKQESIFRAFEQVDGSIAREYGGTGLGLSVTKSLVEFHGGKIWFESTEKLGTTFHFTLPISEDSRLADRTIETIQESFAIHSIVPNEENLQEENLTTEEVIELKDGKKIMVVDDEPVNIQVLQNQLHLNNYQVISANDGFQALEILPDANPDLILLDLMMPRMNGYEVVQKIRETHNPSKLPIIMLTAKSQIRDLVQAFDCGANDYLTKPFNKEELLKRIKTHLYISKINLSYERFVPQDFLIHLNKESIIDVQLGNHVLMEMSVLFSDIRSFTTLSESMTPGENFKFLNSYLRQIGPVIREENGFIDKYIGDAIMALFENADYALQGAIKMLQKLFEYNEERKKAGYQPIQIGIGINTGNLMLGIIGEENRMEGTVISDAVNLASRVERMTKMYGSSILITDQTFHSLRTPEQYSMRLVDRVTVKGKTEPVTVWDVFEGDLPEIKEAKMKISNLFEKAIFLYYSKQFEEALVVLEQCISHYPEDKVTSIYMKRCQHYLKVGWDEDWDGVTNLDSK